ncbi:U32 family peptidase [Paenibacillus radicis (ex Xue et al. 2023)]|uniref:U32 family peptidase n=1 Tax=Paenibacillus radicis (ex Xue et al. 2023) TaxID=2972489 RepID=A0ABT1YFV7_9BACL|nr:U32 family peptidase [Paenibacillus radicis (ex Xue et al. 2023)]MCR8631595.1 U32 family peptidase [Paenibacillus radicis (ex Xue et al. 2023)]
MDKSKALLKSLGFLDREAYDLPDSAKRFPDGAQYRLEIPSVEGPGALKAVFEEADKYGLIVHRVSQGSGIMLLTDEEITEMVELCAQRGVELSLFVGPRGTWDISALPLTPAGKVVALRHEGIDQLVYAMEDLQRANRLGVRGALVADEGLLLLTKEMKKQGLIAPDFVIKVSVQMMAANPVSIKLMEDIGADTYNVPTALTLPKLASIRPAIDIPIDLYVEVPDGLGGFIRHYEIPEFIRILSPVYIKFGLRNHPDVYPSGIHLEQVNINLCRERVRRAYMGMQLLKQYAPEMVTSELGAPGLGVPVPQK